MHPQQMYLYLQATTGTTIPLHLNPTTPKPEYTVPQNIFVNGKFVPNVDNVKVPYPKLPGRNGFYSPPNLAK
jgi:hypothetical protein